MQQPSQACLKLEVVLNVFCIMGWLCPFGNKEEMLQFESEMSPTDSWLEFLSSGSSATWRGYEMFRW